MILFTAFVVAVYNFIKGKEWLKGASCISFMLTVLSAFVNITENKIPVYELHQRINQKWLIFSCFFYCTMIIFW